MARINKKYTPEFIIEVIETKIREKLSTNEAAARFNLLQRLIDINILIIKELETGNEFILKKVKKVFMWRNAEEEQKVKLENQN